MKERYIQGETATYEIADAGYERATLHIGASRYTPVKDGGKWTATIPTDDMSGRYRFAFIADGAVRETGAFVVSPLVSKYKAVVDAIDAALQKVATNGKYSLSVGEISLQDKTFDEMIKAKNYYQHLADADEAGTTPSFAPRRVSEVYV